MLARSPEKGKGLGAIQKGRRARGSEDREGLSLKRHHTVGFGVIDNEWVYYEQLEKCPGISRVLTAFPGDFMPFPGDFTLFPVELEYATHWPWPHAENLPKCFEQPLTQLPLTLEL